MPHPLVSLLTPCYNTGNCVHRLLDSVLAQSYPAVEMVVVDDGSTDGTAGVVEGFAARFAARGYSLRCVRQPNQGQSAAIQAGLALVSGDYLAWPDSDDYYATPTALATMVARLEAAPREVAVVRSMMREVEEGTLREVVVHGADCKEMAGRELFDDCLFFEHGFYIQPGAFMVRTEALRRVTCMKIYTAKDAGQNWQLFLPLFYSYRCVMVKEVLFCVLRRSGSHTRGQYVGYDALRRKDECFEAVAVETVRRIDAMPAAEKEEYIEKIRYRHLRERLAWAYKHRRRDDYRRLYRTWASGYADAHALGNRLAYWAVTLHMEALWDVCRKALDR